MSRIEVPMPQMGESIAEGTVSRWLKAVGDRVEVDEPILEISTDKVDAEIPSPSGGVLVEITVPEGETVEVGTIVGVIDPAGDGADGGAAPTAATEVAGEPAGAAAGPQAADAATTAGPRRSSGRKTLPRDRPLPRDHRPPRRPRDRGRTPPPPLDPGGAPHRRRARRRHRPGPRHRPRRKGDQAGHPQLHRRRASRKLRLCPPPPSDSGPHARCGSDAEPPAVAPAASGPVLGADELWTDFLRRGAQPRVPRPLRRPRGSDAQDPPPHRRPHGGGEAGGAPRPLLHRGRLHPHRRVAAPEPRGVAGARRAGQLHRLHRVGLLAAAARLPDGQLRRVGPERHLPRQRQPGHRGRPEPRPDRARHPRRGRLQPGGHGAPHRRPGRARPGPQARPRATSRERPSR